MNITPIEWVIGPDGWLGYTWNPITGCLNHDNKGNCLGGGFPCYAYRLANGRLKERYLANKNIAPIDKYPTDYTPHEAIRLIHLRDGTLHLPFYPRFWPERLAELKRRNDMLSKSHDHAKPRGIFICDMSDLFGIGVPEEWTQAVMDEIWGNKGYDRFFILTKQPQNLVKWSPYPDNCWIGVTATKSNLFWNALFYLKDIKAKVKYLSLEPLLTGIEAVYSPWSNFPPVKFIAQISDNLKLAGINWLIIGALTSKRREDLIVLHESTGLDVVMWHNTWTLQPKLEWVEEIAHAAGKSNVSVFMKNNLTPLYESNFDSYELRQEIPHV